MIGYLQPMSSSLDDFDHQGRLTLRRPAFDAVVHRQTHSHVHPGSRGSFSLGRFSRGYDADIDTIPARMRSCGFSDVPSRDLTVERVIHDPNTNIPLEIIGNPVGRAVAARGEKAVAIIVSDVMATYFDCFTAHICFAAAGATVHRDRGLNCRVVGFTTKPMCIALSTRSHSLWRLSARRSPSFENAQG